MKRNKLLCAIVVPALACGMAAAQEKGIWPPASSSAQSITGEVTFSNDKISIDYSGFAIAQIRDLQPGEVNAVFEADSTGSAGGHLYRLNIPGSKKFLHHNTLCGSEDTQWMATYVARNYLHLAFFSGQKMPVLTPEALANSTDLCGTFSYAR